MLTRDKKCKISVLVFVAFIGVARLKIRVAKMDE